MGVKLGKKQGGRRRSHRVMSDINVTPLVDVMLVLLIVFMVTAPLLTAGMNIDLPKAQSRALHTPDSTPLEITVDAKGNIFMGQTAITADRLRGVLSGIAHENPDRRVYVKADGRLSYGQVMAVMGVASASGFTKIALITDPSMAIQGQ